MMQANIDISTPVIIIYDSLGYFTKRNCLDGLLAVTLFALDPPLCDIFHCQLEVAWHEIYDCNERNWVSTIWDT